MCFFSYTATGFAAVSDPDELDLRLIVGPPPPLPKKLFLFLGLAPTLQHLVETALAGECGFFRGFQRIHLN